MLSAYCAATKLMKLRAITERPTSVAGVLSCWPVSQSPVDSTQKIETAADCIRNKLFEAQKL